MARVPSVVPAPRPERDFCSNCGFPVRGGRCDACGSSQEAAHSAHNDDDIPTRQTAGRAYVSPADADPAGLDRAFDAFRAKDMPRFVEQVLAGEGGPPLRAAPTPDGPGWIAVVKGTLVFVTLRQDEVLLEAPIARLPGQQRLPALRLALELCAQGAASSRVALRGDLLLLRSTPRIGLLTPPVLRHFVREIAHLAARYAGLLTVSLDALPAFSDDQRGAISFESLGHARRIQFAGGAARRSIAPVDGGPQKPVVPKPGDANGGVRRHRTGSRPLPRDEGPSAAPSPDAVVIPKPPAKPRIPSPDGGMGTADTIPAILSPARAAPDDGGISRQPSGDRGQTTQTGAIPDGSARRPSAYETSVAGKPPSSNRTEIEIETTSRRAITTQEVVRPKVDAGSTPGSAPNPVADLSPSDRLCLLLRHAQSLASMALEERPATMTWLMRSAVFRAIYDFKDLLPDAVAHLYRCTGVARDAGTSSRVSAQLQATEPALVVMERVIVARGQVAREKPLAIEPMTSAAQAKEHVARYLGEIDKSPNDLSMRHFLALGALTELLVRTKLPPQTDQRLRDIVAHAQREGAKAGAIDLMMTALQRINS